MGKRPTLKGKGMGVFLEEERKPSKREVISKKEKGTFYLPPSLLTSLDNVWFALRKHNRKIRKSDIVKVALDEALSKFNEEGADSRLFKHLTS